MLTDGTDDVWNWVMRYGFRCKGIFGSSLPGVLYPEAAGYGGECVGYGEFSGVEKWGSLGRSAAVLGKGTSLPESQARRPHHPPVGE